MPEHNPSLASLLRSFMDRDGWSPQVLARIAGISKETLKNWLNGSTLRPYRWQPLLLVADTLRLSRDEVDRLLRAAQQRSILELAQNTTPEDHQLLRPWLAPLGLPQDNTAELSAEQRLQTIPTKRIQAPQPLPARSRIPFPPNPQFLGRDDTLQRIAATFKTPTNSTVVLSGTAGMGKTQTAVEFAHRYGSYFAGGVFWISCVNPRAIPQEIAACGDPYGFVHDQTFRQIPLDQQVQLVQAAWQDSIPRLLVFDNCDDPAVLQEWCPPTGGCRILVTSRYQGWPMVLGVTELSLAGLSREHSRSLLGALGDCASDTQTLAALDAIAASVGDVPLALYVIGMHLQRYRYVLTPQVYLESLRSETLLKHPSFTSTTDALSPTNHDLHIARSLMISYQELATDDPVDQTAARLLALLAWCAPNTPISRTLIYASMGAIQDDNAALLRLEDAVRRVVTIGLISDTGDLLVHPMIQSFLQLNATTAADQHAWEAGLLTLGQEALVSGRTLVALQPIQAHVHYALSVAGDRTDVHSIYLHLIMGVYATFSGNEERGLRAITEGLAWLAGQDKKEPLLIGLLQMYRGALFYQQSDYATAEAALLEALEANAIARHPRLQLLCLNRLGLTAWMRGQITTAQGYFEACLTLAMSLNDHVIEAAVLTNQANLLSDPAEFDTVHRLYTRSLALHRQNGNLQGCGTVLNNLGYLAIIRGDYTRARVYLDECLHINQALRFTSHIALAQINRGALALALGDLASAAECYHEALTLTPTRHTLMLAGIFEHVARWYVAQSRWSQALAVIHVGQRLRNEADAPREPYEEEQYRATLERIHQHHPVQRGEHPNEPLNIANLVQTVLAHLAAGPSG